MTPQHPAAPEGETDASGLIEAEKHALNSPLQGFGAGLCGPEPIYVAVERIVAERLRVVEGERDAARESRDRWKSTAQSHYDTALRQSDRAESAEAAHAALREVAENIAYEHAATIDGEFGCCHDETALRAGGRVPEFDGDEFDPIPDDCLGKQTLDRHLAALLLAGGGA